MQVAIIMGSDSDWPKLGKARDLLEEFGIDAEVRVLSAHRTPAECVEYVRRQRRRGAGSSPPPAWRFAGVVAALTRRPVIGAPAAGPRRLYSVVQMPQECRGHRDRQRP